MASSYITPCSVTESSAFLIKPETCVQVGTSRLYGALETSSWTYATYEASIGLEAGQSLQLGILAELTFAHQPAFEAVESYNTTDDALYEVTGEETMATIGIREFKSQVIELALGTGVMYSLGSERVYTFGGGCSMLRRPYTMEFMNESCFAPTAEDVALGITGGAITLYDCFISSGLEWAMTAKEGNTVTLEVQALPVLARSRGNRLGSMLLY